MGKATDQPRPQIRPGVGVMVWKQGRLLLGQRPSPAPCWQFPGGHIEAGETVAQCAEREVREETGLRIHRCEPAGYGNLGYDVAGATYFTLFVSADCEAGEPQVMEPEKCSDWRWFSPHQLPQPLFQPITNYLLQYPDLSVLQPALLRQQGMPASVQK